MKSDKLYQAPADDDNSVFLLSHIYKEIYKQNNLIIYILKQIIFEVVGPFSSSVPLRRYLIVMITVRRKSRQIVIIIVE